MSAAPHPRAPAQVFTVFSTKGGAGTTVIATNLAILFAQAGRETLLIDLDLHSGDAALALGILPRPNLLDVIRPGYPLDAASLRRHTSVHESGLHLLAAPTRPDHEELVPADRLKPLLEAACDGYEVVVIDTASQFAPASLAALDATDTLLLVGAPDLPTVKSLKIAMETLQLLGLGRLDLRVLMNRADTEVDLGGDQIERTLRRPIAFEVPSDIAVPMSLNHACPVVLDAAQSSAAVALRKVAGSLVTPSGDGRIPQ